jgi:hypothetical protein
MRHDADNQAVSIRGLWVVALLVGLLVGSGVARSQELSLAQPQGLDRVGIYALREIDPSLTGEGVRLGIVSRSVTYADGEPQNDYQPNVGHACLRGAALRFFDDGALPGGVSFHSTAICSILFGFDAAGTSPYLDPFLYQGVVPGAEGQIYEFQHFLTQYVSTGTRPDVDVLAASVGWPFEAWWTRGIEALAEHEGLVVVASIGNGAEASDPPMYPGASANAIGVGVVSSVKADDPAMSLSHFALAYPARSSPGPTLDGRCKPDLIAPGNCLVAGTAEASTYDLSGDWSSYATPVVAGVVGLLIQTAEQDATLEAILSPDGGNCALKAILMNSATKLPFWHKGRLGDEDDGEVPLDLVQGAGMVNAMGAHQLLTAGRVGPGDVPTVGWDLNELEAGQGLPQVYRMVVDEPAGKMLTATLAWNRHYGREYPFERMAEADSDLRLEVWVVDPEGSGDYELLYHCDSRVDNVEHIYMPMSAAHHIYAVVVSHSDGQRPDEGRAAERYGLAWSVGEEAERDSILKYDLNADGVVDGADIAVFLSNKSLGLTTPGAYVIGDINADGEIDGSDLERLYANRQRTADWHPGTATN